MPRFRCEECGYMVTRGPSGVEYGHSRGRRTDKERCPRRPAGVDPAPTNGRPRASRRASNGGEAA